MTEQSPWITGRRSTWKRSNRYGSYWQQLRPKILKRDPRCQLAYPDICLGKSTEVDHILPVYLGGDEDPANLRGVCKKCHARRTSEQAREARRRKRG